MPRRAFRVFLIAVCSAVVCLVAFFVPRIYVTMARGRRLRAFINQLGDTIHIRRDNRGDLYVPPSILFDQKDDRFAVLGDLDASRAARLGRN